MDRHIPILGLNADRPFVVVSESFVPGRSPAVQKLPGSRIGQGAIPHCDPRVTRFGAWGYRGSTRRREEKKKLARGDRSRELGSGASFFSYIKGNRLLDFPGLLDLVETFTQWRTISHDQLTG